MKAGEASFHLTTLSMSSDRKGLENEAPTFEVRWSMPKIILCLDPIELEQATTEPSPLHSSSFFQVTNVISFASEI